MTSNLAGTDEARRAAAQLDALAVDLTRRGFLAEMLHEDGAVKLRAVNPAAPGHGEHIITIAADDNGVWWFWWPWGERTGRVGYIVECASKIAWMLTPQRGERMNPVAVAKPSMRVFRGSRHEVRNVREFITQAVDGCPVGDDVILLGSEVATNAVVHTASGKGGTFTVVVRPGAGVIRVEVYDGGSETAPDVRAPEDLTGSGRGLSLVESLATRWGHLGNRDGRVVWFEVEWQCSTRRNGEKLVKHDPLFEFQRSDLERLKLAAEVIIAEAEEYGDVIPAPLESELVIFKARVEKALLLPEDADWVTIA